MGKGFQGEKSLSYSGSQEYKHRVKSESISRGLRKSDSAYGRARHLGFIFISMQWKGIEELEEEAEVSWVT